MKRLDGATGLPFRRGTVRADGFVFQGYHWRFNGDGFRHEVWLCPASYERASKRARAYALAWRAARRERTT